MNSYTPKELGFCIGGFGPWWEVVWEDGNVVCRRGDMGAPGVIVAERAPTAGEWETFWRGLDAAGVWDWQPTYRCRPRRMNLEHDSETSNNYTKTAPKRLKKKLFLQFLHHKRNTKIPAESSCCKN